MKYVIFDKSGASDAMPMVWLFNGSEEDTKAQCSETQGYTTAADDVTGRTHYIKRSTLKANRRDTTPCTPSATTVVADGVAEITLSQMRDGTTIKITGPGEVETTVTGDNARETIRFTSPGTYTIIATAPFPALPKEIVIHAS